jgi:hypothetical protein
MNDLWLKIAKYKNVLLALGSAGLVLAQYFIHGFTVPAWAFPLMGAIGLTTFRVDLSSAGAYSGWKTYATALALAGDAVAQALGVPVPAPFTGFLALLGVGWLGHAVVKVNAQ